MNRSKCPSCAVLWAGDQRVKLLRNVEEYGGDVALVTITAPGKDRLPWDGGMVRRDLAQQWNQTAPQRWTRMHKRAAARTKRYARRMGSEWQGVVAWSWEFQKRGVLHRHVLLQFLL